VRGEILETNPAIANILAVVNRALSTEAITALNAKVDIEQEEYEDVAKNFYASVRNR
jgi:osmoprotectant transport system substrate-binding protein